VEAVLAAVLAVAVMVVALQLAEQLVVVKAEAVAVTVAEMQLAEAEAVHLEAVHLDTEINSQTFILYYVICGNFHISVQFYILNQTTKNFVIIAKNGDFTYDNL
jgi:hypothetical protein